MQAGKNKVKIKSVDKKKGLKFRFSSLKQVVLISTDVELCLLHCIGLKWPTSQMANRILKFMIGHLGLGLNVQLGLVDFKVLRSVNRDWF